MSAGVGGSRRRDGWCTPAGSGCHLKYQVTFWDDPWGGRSDFLLKVDKPSVLGDWSYGVLRACGNKACPKHESRAFNPTNPTLLLYSTAVTLSKDRAAMDACFSWGHYGGRAISRSTIRCLFPQDQKRIKNLRPTTYRIYPEPVEHCDV